MRAGCVVVVLLLLLLSGSEARHRVRRSIGQFGDMIRAVVRREALLYNNYGNHCGFQGAPDIPVVDEVDRCCFHHDQCYREANREACSSSWLGASWERYSWNHNASAPACDDGAACSRAVCECDVAAVTCFTAHPWNPAHKNPSIWDVLA